MRKGKCDRKQDQEIKETKKKKIQNEKGNFAINHRSGNSLKQFFFYF